jgi:hypothetical protein
MNSIGGYFNLEIRKNKEFHSEALKLNTGRNAFEYILLANKYDTVYLPYYTCDVLIQPLKKHRINYTFYHIDESFEAVFEFTNLNVNDAFLYTNYFGLKDSYIHKLFLNCPNLIVDNSQSFYSLPIDGVDTFYSPRKFFGVADGAYLFSNNKIKQSTLVKDISWDRMSHLLKRTDIGPEFGYHSFKINDGLLNDLEIMEMSELTQSILSSIDYDFISKRRKSNFYRLHENLKLSNELKFDYLVDQTPMVYPYLNSSLRIKEKLLKNRVFTPTYWPNVIDWTDTGTLEYRFAQDIVFLPIDQRYDEIEMNFIIEIIKEEIFNQK